MNIKSIKEACKLLFLSGIVTLARMLLTLSDKVDKKRNGR